jgi:hypothetical protein
MFRVEVWLAIADLLDRLHTPTGLGISSRKSLLTVSCTLLSWHLTRLRRENHAPGMDWEGSEARVPRGKIYTRTPRSVPAALSRQLYMIRPNLPRTEGPDPAVVEHNKMLNHSASTVEQGCTCCIAESFPLPRRIIDLLAAAFRFTGLGLAQLLAPPAILDQNVWSLGKGR